MCGPNYLRVQLFNHYKGDINRQWTEGVAVVCVFVLFIVVAAAAAIVKVRKEFTVYGASHFVYNKMKTDNV